jgi:hypothetical protein
LRPSIRSEEWGQEGTTGRPLPATVTKEIVTSPLAASGSNPHTGFRGEDFKFSASAAGVSAGASKRFSPTLDDPRPSTRPGVVVFCGILGRSAPQDTNFIESAGEPSKPASKGRFKTSHFEETQDRRLGSGASPLPQEPDHVEPAQDGRQRNHPYTAPSRLFSASNSGSTARPSLVTSDRLTRRQNQPMRPPARSGERARHNSPSRRPARHPIRSPATAAGPAAVSHGGM